MKDKDLREMNRAGLEDEVMLLRAKCKVQDNELLSLREQLRSMVAYSGLDWDVN